jgi:cobalamin biosynthesis protein CobT
VSLYVPWRYQPGIAVGTEDRTKEVEVAMADEGNWGVQFSVKEGTPMVNIRAEDVETYLLLVQNLIEAAEDGNKFARLTLDEIPGLKVKKSKSKKSKDEDDDEEEPEDDDGDDDDDDEDEKPRKKSSSKAKGKKTKKSRR